VAAAHQTGVVRAVADDIAFRTQNSTLQRDGIQNLSALPRTRNTRTVHHRTSLNLRVILPFFCSIFHARISVFTVALKHGAAPLWKPLCYAQIGGWLVAILIISCRCPAFMRSFVLDLKILKWETKPVESLSTQALESGSTPS
jgi:hypothetical protein